MPTFRDIHTNQLDVACDICGRTLLRGERAEPFLAGGARRQVCELCTVRAQHEGWIREAGADDVVPRTGGYDRRGRGLLDRLRARRRTGSVDGAWAASEASSSVEAQAPEPSEAPEPARDPHPTPAEPAVASRRPRHVRAVPTNADLKMQRALEVFNRSDHTRTVGGVSRSLGAPAVCVRPLGERPSVVAIAVMWELSWYRYEIDLSDEGTGVQRVGQGDELSELRPEEQLVNAAADERGGLHLALTR